MTQVVLIICQEIGWFFKHLKEVSNQTIRLGDGKILRVSGISSIALRSSCGRTNTLTNIQFAPHIMQNLLSVGQSMSSIYIMEFLGVECAVKDAASKAYVAQVCITSHRLFPLEANDVGVAQEEAVLSDF